MVLRCPHAIAATKKAAISMSCLAEKICGTEIGSDEMNDDLLYWWAF